jgi:hypothetical protein
MSNDPKRPEFEWSQVKTQIVCPYCIVVSAAASQHAEEALDLHLAFAHAPPMASSGQRQLPDNRRGVLEGVVASSRGGAFMLDRLAPLVALDDEGLDYTLAVRPRAVAIIGRALPYSNAAARG